jgi:hypothetical protein
MSEDDDGGVWMSDERARTIFPKYEVKCPKDFSEAVAQRSVIYTKIHYTAEEWQKLVDLHTRPKLRLVVDNTKPVENPKLNHSETSCPASD